MAYRKGSTRGALIVGLLVLFLLNVLFVLLDKGPLSPDRLLDGVVIPKWREITNNIVSESDLGIDDINLFLPALIIPLVAGIFSGMLARGAPRRGFWVGFGLGFAYYYLAIVLLILLSIFPIFGDVTVALPPSGILGFLLFLFTVPLPLAILSGIGGILSVFVLSKYASLAYKSAFSKLTNALPFRKKESKTLMSPSEIYGRAESEASGIQEGDSKEQISSRIERILASKTKEPVGETSGEEPEAIAEPEPQPIEPEQQSVEQLEERLDQQLSEEPLEQPEEPEERLVEEPPAPKGQKEPADTEGSDAEGGEETESISPIIRELRKSLKDKPARLIEED
ncbi:MAG: hypothetical protein JXB14_06000 [Candidatus Altiarchaeota archaeon]|nr:hypothetical protein [Candidatus Altiarchaeota archaeon]